MQTSPFQGRWEHGNRLMDTHLSERQVIIVPTPARWVFLRKWRRIDMKFKNFLIALLAILLILSLGLGWLLATGRITSPWAKTQQANITAEMVEEQLEKCADLTTAKLTYKGVVNFTEGQIKYITQNSFNMMYTADVIAGIDMTKVTAEVQEPANGNPGKVIVTVPKATVQSIKIDPDSLQFYDTKWALFNRQANTDVQEALVAAEADAKKNMGKKELIATAQTQAEEVISGFVGNILPEGYELEIN